jgi:hypothetical protein
MSACILCLCSSAQSIVLVARSVLGGDAGATECVLPEGGDPGATEGVLPEVFNLSVVREPIGLRNSPNSFMPQQTSYWKDSWGGNDTKCSGFAGS